MGLGNSQYSKPAEIQSRVFPALVESMPRMEGKVVAITGCTTGTGFILAKACAGLGAHVVMLNRASSRADDALAAIQKEVPGSKLSAIPCDLMRFESVRQAAAQLLKDFADTGVDVLCNNAGIMATPDEATADGYDLQMQVNHLSHFLLTADVWPLLEKAASKHGEARVVNHSSGARRGKALEARYLGKNGGDLGGDELGCAPFSGGRWERYQQTKLANVVFTYALDDKIRAAGSKVKALVAHPGLAATNLQVKSAGDGGMAPGFTDCLMKYASQSGEDGTAGIFVCCCKQHVESGQFWGPKGITGEAVLMNKADEETKADAASRTMLWAESEKAMGANFII